jgi:succinyl-CoA synthetase alpha subunit
MGILVDKNTRVVVQGITGRDGSFHTKGMIDYGTKVVAGVTPGKGGGRIAGVPVYDTMAAAVHETGANTSVVYVPPRFAVDALYEAADSGVDLVVCITEGLPANDMLKVARYLDVCGVRLVGPNCPGVITPGVCKVGIMPGVIHKRGPVGVVSRSGTLTYEVVYHLTRAGIGQSTCLGIGGDPVIGTRFLDVLEMYERDRQTEAVVLIGEIGGTDEEVAAEYIKTQMTKPVVSFIAGRTAPPGKRMGHAGAIIAGGAGTAAEKIAAFRAAGVEVAETPAEIAKLVAGELAQRSQRKQARVINVRPTTSMAAKSKSGTRAATGKKTARAKAKPAPKAKRSTAKTAAKAKAKTKKPVARAKTKVKPKAKAKPKARTTRVSKAKPKSKAVARSKAKPRAKAKPKARTTRVSRAKPKAKATARAKAKPKARTTSKSKSKTTAKAGTKKRTKARPAAKPKSRPKTPARKTVRPSAKKKPRPKAKKKPVRRTR